jgi:uncharacterized protein (TIGR00661 family)
LRILYGLCGEGMGHAMRSIVVGRHLVERGHRVQFACSKGRALGKLREEFDYFSSVEIPGLQSVTVRGVIHPELTLARNLLGQAFTSSPLKHLGAWLSTAPFDAVVSDFDPWTARLAGLLRKPLLAVDNIHFLTHCRHPEGMIGASDLPAAASMFSVVKGMVPKADRYLITSIAQAPILKDRTAIHLPILREEVLKLREGRERGSHLVAYFNERVDPRSTIAALQGVGAPVHVYGFGEGQFGYVSLRNISRDFLPDLASARACIGGGGFTLMSETMALGTPLFTIPIPGQFEQKLNGLYLQAMGLGEWGELGGLRDRLPGFLSRSEIYRERLSKLSHDGNKALLADVDRFLEGQT